MEQRLSIITLGVSDLKKSRSFYESLGWRLAGSDPKEAESIVAFNLQSFVLALYPIEELGKDVGHAVKPLVMPTFTLAYNVRSEAEVDQTIREVKSLGAKVIKKPQKVFWGGYSAYFSDLDGYLWEVAFNPHATLEKDGTFRWT